MNTNSSVTISRCLFLNNVLGAALGFTTCGGFFDDGGGAQISNSTAFIENSTFSFGAACRGGGLFVSGGPTNSFIINQSTFSNNEAKTRGGGLMIFGTPKVSLNFNTISSNKAATQTDNTNHESHIAGSYIVAEAAMSAV